MFCKIYFIAGKYRYMIKKLLQLYNIAPAGSRIRAAVVVADRICKHIGFPLAMRLCILLCSKNYSLATINAINPVESIINLS